MDFLMTLHLVYESSQQKYGNFQIDTKHGSAERQSRNSLLFLCAAHRNPDISIMDLDAENKVFSSHPNLFAATWEDAIVHPPK
jgi:spore cortex formation protein SpoVR/YcgB (stage V sporulation)